MLRLSEKIYSDKNSVRDTYVRKQIDYRVVCIFFFDVAYAVRVILHREKRFFSGCLFVGPILVKFFGTLFLMYITPYK